MAEYGLRGGQIRLDTAQRADVDDDADGGLLARLGPRRHDVDLGDALAVAVVVRHVGGQPERHHAGPLAAVEDLRHLALATLPADGLEERLDGVGADGALRGDAEDLLGAQAPLVDQAVGADREGCDLDVVVHGAGRGGLPHGVTGRGIAG